MKLSSQVSHVPHGVGPPAQLSTVPARLTRAASTRRRGSDEQRRRATGVDVCVVGHAGGVRHRGEAFVGHVVGLQLVVAHERDPAASCREGRHAVMRSRHRRPVVEHVDRLARQDLVAEPAWQVEQTGGIGLEVAIAGRPGRAIAGDAVSRLPSDPLRAKPAPDPVKAEEATSIDGHHQPA